MLDWDPCLILKAQDGIFHPATVPREHLSAPGNLGAGGGAQHGPFGGQPELEMSPEALQEFSLTPAGAISVCLGSPQLASGTLHLRRGYTTAKLLDPTGTMLPPCFSPSPHLRVSPCLSHGFGAAKCTARGLQACGASSTAQSHGSVSSSPAGHSEWLPGSPGRGRQVLVDLASIPEIALVSRQAGWGIQKDPGAVC